MHNDDARTERIKALRNSVEEHAEVLAQQMAEGKSEALIKYLEFCSQFHTYSFHNILLAFCQRPDMSRIAGLRQWNKLGRRVKAGEKGIVILAPITVKREKGDRRGEDGDGFEDEEPKRVTLFKAVYVFDVSQTEGDPLPDLICATGDPGDLYPALAVVIERAGIVIETLDVIPGSFGAYGVSCGGRILIRADLPPANGFRTLVHEYAHEILHKKGIRESKTIRETEADATAFIVCRHFGIECDSAEYLMLYDSTTQVLLGRLETIRATACAIIEAISDSRELVAVSGQRQLEIPTHSVG